MTTNAFRVLVADDEQGVVWLWARILQWECDAEVTAVFDGKTALARIRDERFDLVITDLQMPGASGLDVLREAARRAPPIPVVLCTGHASAQVLGEASRIGVCQILTKPFDDEKAASLARELLAHARAGTSSARRASHCH